MAQPYIGEIRMFAGNFAPAGWAFCNGSPLPISEYDTLFNLIGTTYGGDGQETFNLPDLQGRVPIHMGGGFQIGELAGVEQVTLTSQQIPQHTHPLLVNGSGGSANDPTNHVLGASPSIDLYRESSVGVQLAGTTVLGTGGSEPHTNFQPYLCVNFILSLFGIYPPPN